MTHRRRGKTMKRKHGGYRKDGKGTTLSSSASLPSPAVLNGDSDYDSDSNTGSSTTNKTLIIAAVVVGGVILLS